MFLLWLAMSGNPALADILACPQPITVKESLGQPAPTGWSERVDSSPRYLDFVTFFDGDPSNRASLVPDRDVESRKGKGGEAVWSFKPSGVPIWLGCNYLATRVMLVQQLPLAYRECRVTYDDHTVKSIRCKPNVPGKQSTKNPPSK